jgi:small subunit ribosomal protein S2
MKGEFMSDVSLIDMLKAGVHFGHQESRRHPKMNPFIFATRGGVSIINLEKTKTALSQATSFVHDLVARGGTLLFVGTKRQARDIVRAAAEEAGMPFIVDRWIGGLFTNFAQVRQLGQKLHRLKEERADGTRAKYTKKEQLTFDMEIERLEQLIGGVANMERLPEAIFVVDVKQEKTAVHEAQALKIPIVAMCDTNINPTAITFPIPANDDATKSLQLITAVVVDAVRQGRAAGQATAAAAALESARQAAEVAANPPPAK